MEAHNSQRMREVLAEIRLLLVRVPLSIKPDIACGIINAKVKHALSARARNCDIGTAEEQAERWQKFCDKHFCCEECDFNIDGDVTAVCFAHWAQMPYEEGGSE